MAVISNIHPLWDALPISVGKDEREYSERTALPVFEQIFQEAIDNVRQTDQEKNKAEYLMATGQLDNPAIRTIASTKAQMSVELLVQLRNKALDAYSELSRMSI